MARSGKNSGMFSWFRHRRLIEVEAILLAGVAQELVQRKIKAMAWPHWGQTLWIMGCTLGMLGGLVLVLRAFAQGTVAGTHRAARRLPFRLPLLAMHGAALFALFVLYAWVWKLWPPF
jgi:hypothetical protein